MIYDPAKVLDPDLRIRAANAYQAALDYTQNRLDVTAYADFLTLLSAYNLPTDSDQVLTIPNAMQYVDAVRVLAMHFVTEGGRYINVDTVTSTSTVLQDLQIRGNLEAAAITAVDVDFSGDVSIAGVLAVTGDAAINGDAAVTGQLSVSDRVLVGAGAPDPGAQGLSVDGPLLCTYMAILATSDPSSAADGSFGEDVNGDIFYKSLSGSVTMLNRPKHDTGWLTLSDLCLGIVGVQPADPSQTPDTYFSLPMTLDSAEPGSVGGPTRIVVWVRADKSLVDGGAATSTYYYFQTHAYPVAGVQEGVSVHVDGVTSRVSITYGLNELVPGQPGISIAASPAPELRVMIWTR